MRLSIQSVSASSGPTDSSSPPAGVPFKERRLLLPVPTSTTIAQLFDLIYERYRAAYLEPSQYGAFNILKLTDEWDNDLTTDLTVGDAFDDRPGFPPPVVRLHLSRRDRSPSVPLLSTLRGSSKRSRSPNVELPSKRTKVHDEFSELRSRDSFEPDTPMASAEQGSTASRVKDKVVAEEALEEAIDRTEIDAPPRKRKSTTTRSTLSTRSKSPSSRRASHASSSKDVKRLLPAKNSEISIGGNIYAPSSTHNKSLTAPPHQNADRSSSSSMTRRKTTPLQSRPSFAPQQTHGSKSRDKLDASVTDTGQPMLDETDIQDNEDGNDELLSNDIKRIQQRTPEMTPRTSAESPSGHGSRIRIAGNLSSKVNGHRRNSDHRQSSEKLSRKMNDWGTSRKTESGSRKSREKSAEALVTGQDTQSTEASRGSAGIGATTAFEGKIKEAKGRQSLGAEATSGSTRDTESSTRKEAEPHSKLNGHISSKTTTMRDRSSDENKTLKQSDSTDSAMPTSRSPASKPSSSFPGVTTVKFSESQDTGLSNGIDRTVQSDPHGQESQAPASDASDSILDSRTDDDDNDNDDDNDDDNAVAATPLQSQNEEIKRHPGDAQHSIIPATRQAANAKSNDNSATKLEEVAGKSDQGDAQSAELDSGSETSNSSDSSSDTSSLSKDLSKPSKSGYTDRPAQSSSIHSSSNPAATKTIASNPARIIRLPPEASSKKIVPPSPSSSDDSDSDSSSSLSSHSSDASDESLQRQLSKARNSAHAAGPNSTASRTLPAVLRRVRAYARMQRRPEVYEERFEKGRTLSGLGRDARKRMGWE